ncbi:MAG: peptidoglycan-binding protein [Ilumatobacteraceae bacterium]
MNHDRLTELLEDRADEVALRAGSLKAVRRRARHRQARQRVAVGAAGVAVIGGVAAGVAVRGNDRTPRVGPAETIGSDVTAATQASTTPASTTPPLQTPLSRGSAGNDVRALQQRLLDLRFDPGPVSGVFDERTEQAVWAFEGLVLGRPSTEQTGVVDAAAWQAMQDQIVIQPRRAEGEGSTHMEIYLDTQVGILFIHDSPGLITHISSGTGETWCELLTYDTDDKGMPLEVPIQKDVCGVAKTPGGVFEFYRRYEGNRATPLGGMYNPLYFNYGIAIYGAENVPVRPASHGGIRIPMFIADRLPLLVKNGDRVYIWDGEKEPEDQSKDDMVPFFNYPNPDSTAG